MATEQQKELRKKLVEALRSGNFKQGKMRLKLRDRYCCMGVACIVAGRKFVRGRCEGRSTVLPESVMFDYGFQSDQGRYKVDTLTSQNDTGATFIEIADIIKYEPKGLFVD